MPAEPRKPVEGITSRTEAGMLDYAYYRRPENLPTKRILWDGSGDNLFTKMIKDALVRESQAVKNGGVIFCCRSGLMTADAVSELGSLIAMRMTGA